MPVQGWVDEAPVREALAEVYRRPEFLSAEKKTLFEILSEWLVRWLGTVEGSAPPWVSRVLIGLVAALGLLLLAQIAWAARGLFARPRRPTARAAGAAPERPEPARHRRSAEEAAARGEYVAAVRALYRYALARLHERGRVRYDESKTGGDYLRELARAPDRGETFARFLSDVERVLFGGRPCGADQYDRLSGMADAVADGAA